MTGHPFDALTPQAVLDALDTVGLRGDGRLLQLNSYENRVFQVFLEDGRAVVAKFYRPGRWSDAQIQEEHALALEAQAEDVPVVAPLSLGDSAATLALAEIDGIAFWFAVQPRVGGRGPEMDDPDTLRWLGRFIARLHNVGARRPFRHRLSIDAQTFGTARLQRLEALDAVPPGQLDGWRAVSRDAVAAAESALAAINGLQTLRLHGDAHRGNILWRDEGPHVVDLDDAAMGPAVQDLWMFLSGPREAMQSQLADVLAGYQSIRDFDRRELALIEPLRTLRMIHHSAWLAERFDDPAFPAAFPWFGGAGYWGQQTTQLREQLAAMAEDPLRPGFDA
ncbi:MAG: serine/threonine protein kinase [Aquabacterium sp.]